MRYRVKDIQSESEFDYFHNGYIFKNKQEILNILKSYHYDVEGINKLPLNEILEIGGWELEEIEQIKTYPVTLYKISELLREGIALITLTDTQIKLKLKIEPFEE